LCIGKKYVQIRTNQTLKIANKIKLKKKISLKRRAKRLKKKKLKFAQKKEELSY
jgi:hypothetical protein